MLSKSILPFIFGCSCLLVSCDDPELIKERGEQEKEIARLKGQITLAEEKLRDMPSDQSGELKQITAETNRLEAERRELADEITKIKAEEAALQKKFDAYKKKYSVD
ncbi:MAG: hypothetical protein ACSHX7_00545 [Luteolibacter sp.]